MLNRIIAFARRRKLLMSSVVVAAFAISIVSIRYFRYEYAIAWHCIHGNYLQFGKYQLVVPILWWVDKDQHHYDTYIMTRADSSSAAYKSELTVRPALPGSILKTNEGVLKSIESMISVEGQMSDPPRVLSVKTVNAKKNTIYCGSEGTIISHVIIYDMLTCRTANIPYSFTYSGPPTREREADSILSTLK